MIIGQNLYIGDYETQIPISSQSYCSIKFCYSYDLNQKYQIVVGVYAAGQVFTKLLPAHTMLTVSWVKSLMHTKQNAHKQGDYEFIKVSR